MKKSAKNKNLITFILGLCLIILLISFYFFIILKPGNNRNWESGTEILPTVQIDNNFVTVKNIRDFSFSPGKVESVNYLNRTFDSNKITKVWFVVEPFDKFDGIAHTYFVFDFSDAEPVAISVEARREKGEKFDPFIGLFNQYELIYIWGTETDATIRRVLIEDNKLYMYPLNISEAGAKNLFIQLAKTTEELETTPRFYNTLLSNCTNELAKAANAIKPNSIPFNLALFLPGYSARELYKLGFIPDDLPLDQLKEKSFISDFVRENYEDSGFSTKLREFLN